MNSVEKRFWSQVDTSSACWRWIGHTTKTGYANFSGKCNGQQFWKAHRYSYCLHNGPIPAGKQVLHTCDNRWCVNPDHLYLGDTWDNMQDMVKNGRSMVGERHWKSKLTEEDVTEIRKSKLSHEELGRQYGCHGSHIARIRTGVRWGHVPLPSGHERQNDG